MTVGARETSRAWRRGAAAGVRAEEAAGGAGWGGWGCGRRRRLGVRAGAAGAPAGWGWGGWGGMGRGLVVAGGLFGHGYCADDLGLGHA